jgi:TRAP transporter 4TM/12TM fusion protein
MRMYMVDEGLFGPTLRTAVTFIFLFILLGSFLELGGVGDFITQLALAIAGKAKGGPAKVAVISSALMGTISGSAAANVATTGSFTIPLMKKMGFNSHFAGAVEAAASTGGIIMPPVMGAAAFLMAEFLGVTYRTIMISALVPAICYFVAIYVAVHLHSLKLGIKGLSANELPKFWPLIRTQGEKLLPLFLLVYLLLTGRTPTFAAFGAMIGVVLTSWLRNDKNRFGPMRIAKALIHGAKDSISVSMACAVIGIVVGITILTDLGKVIGDLVVTLSGQNLLLALLFAAIACLVISMGLPATALYIVGATVMAPAIVRLGALPIAAHLFVFYWGCMSNVTPPVALAAFTGAGIAGADPSKVARTAFMLALPGFLLPFAFVIEPALLLQKGSWLLSLRVALTSILGSTAIAAVVTGYLWCSLELWERCCLLIGSIMLIAPSLITDFVGIGLIVIVVLFSRERFRRITQCDKAITTV